jgi:hypothetical protein
MARSLHLNRLTDAAVFLGVFLVIVGVTAGIYKVYTTADKAHQAICALRADRIRSIEDGRQFLKDHPDGIPGITAADIRRSIDQQQVTVRAFRFADC